VAASTADNVVPTASTPNTSWAARLYLLTCVPLLVALMVVVAGGWAQFAWYTTAGIVLVILLSAVWFTYLFRRYTARRLAELGRLCELIGSGTYSARSQLSGLGELSELAQRFNRMGEELAASYRTLDDRVAQRTRELSLINARMEESNVALQGEIAERARVVQALKESQAHMRAIFETALDAMVTVDGDGRIVEFNPAAERIFGYTASAVLGTQLADTLFSPPESEIQRRRINRYMPAGEGSFLGKRLEVSAKCADGRHVPVEMAMALTYLAAGPLLTVYLRDISERKQAEAQIKSLARFPDESPNPIVRVSDRGAILYANSAAAPVLQHWGVRIGQPLAGRWRHLVSECLQTKQPQDVELECGKQTFSLVAAPIPEANYVNFYGRDITENKRAQRAVLDSEALYHSLVDTLPMCVMRKDLGGHFTFANKLFLQTVDAPLSELVGRTDEDFYPPELAAKYRADDRRVIESSQLFHDVEVNQHPDGTRVFVEVLKTPVYDASGAVVGTQCMFWDVSARKLAEEAVQRTTAELERSNAELQQFAYAASHDLQEPLRKIRAFGDRLESKFGALLTDEGRDYLTRMVSASRRMQLLIDDLLALSRVMTKAEPFTAVDLNQVIQGVLSDLELPIREADASIQVGPLPVIDADPTQMRQLFQNLIGNALKFCPAGTPPRIEISANDSDSVSVEIRVQDHGIGFDEQYAERIFGAFQRLHTREEYPGTGMGLAICRKIVERHRGQITAQGQPGDGATFRITLPRRQQAAKPATESGAPGTARS